MSDPTAAPSTPPVVMVHGWGGSFASTWRSSGVTELLKDAGREVIGVDLLGHGTAPKPHEPEAYADLTARVLDAMPDTPVDAVGFSLGAMTLLRIAIAQPHRFRKLVLAGIGRNLFDDDTSGTEKIIAALEGNAPPDDNIARLFAQYGHQPDNDVVALTAVMKRPRGEAFTTELIGRATCDTLVVIGDKDFAGPGDPLVEALPHARLVTLRNVDHFATPESFGFIDAMLEFLDAIPG
ncbi:MAG: alpha/beta fold hydrolase [Acidimicrobiales bacterium]